MSEWIQVPLFLLKLGLIATYCCCYMIGGRKWKWIRRYLGAGIFGLGVVLFALWQRCFSYYLFFYPILLAVSLSLGYGGNTTLVKLRRRFIYGLLVGASSLPVAFVCGAWVFFGIQVLISILASIVLGVFNNWIPTMKLSAVEEEGLIATSGVCLVLWYLTIPMR